MVAQGLVGELKLCIIRAKGLVAINNHGFYPYVVVEVDGKKAHKTKFRPKTLAPVWNEDLSITLDHSSEVMLNLMDHNVFGKDDLCGLCRLPTKMLKSEASNKTWLSIKPHGEIEVEYTFISTSESVEYQQFQHMVQENSINDPFAAVGPYLLLSANYIRLDQLGKGGFGVVYRVAKRDGMKELAVKIIKKKNLKNEMDIADLLRETTIARLISHPYIVNVFSIFQDQFSVYMIMEILKGGELFDEIVLRSSYSERDASSLLRQLFDAMFYLHSKGIVHADLKPENLLLESCALNSSIKVADFGLSFMTKDPRHVGIVGTASYLCPEVFEHKMYGPPMDMWACGVITYIMICGHLPFWNNDKKTLFKLIKDAVVVFDDKSFFDVSSDCKDLIRRLLARNPKERLSARDALAHPWIMHDSVPLNKHKPGTITELKKFNARRKFKGTGQAIIQANRFLKQSAFTHPGDTLPDASIDDVDEELRLEDDEEFIIKSTSTMVSEKMESSFWPSLFAEFAVAPRQQLSIAVSMIILAIGLYQFGLSGCMLCMLAIANGAFYQT